VGSILRALAFMSESIQPSAYVARLPIGKRLPMPEMTPAEVFPFEGDVQVKTLDPPVLPEPPRSGEPGGPPCWVCTNPDQGVIWRNERWHVRREERPGGLPMVLVLQTNAHHDLDDLPPDLTAELGGMIQRVARAVNTLDGIGRVHFNRWGDGGEHFHVWFLARPAGMRQLRGACIALWNDILPPVPDAEWQSNPGSGRRRAGGL
jgi:diadenosine tetraphosphate (Ap4A) HIT family hydrolase